MKRSLRIAVVLLLLAGTAGTAAALIATESVTLDKRVPSQSIAATVHARVVLPAGYRTSRLRYPVVYFLHGLPAPAERIVGRCASAHGRTPSTIARPHRPAHSPL